MKKTIPLLLALALLLSLPLGGSVARADGDVYQVLVTDGAGEPIGGVMVRFCSDAACVMNATDADGLAAFDQPAGSYTVHILRAPAGYAVPDMEFPAPETPSLMTIVLLSEDSAAAEGSVMDEPDLGFRFVIPEAYWNTKGMLLWDCTYIEDGVQDIMMVYYALSQEEFGDYYDFYMEYMNAAMSGAELPEPPVDSWMSGYEACTVFEIFSINGGRGLEELREIAVSDPSFDGLDFSLLEQIGSDGDTNFFLGQREDIARDEALFREYMGEYYDEFSALCADRDTFLSGLTLTEPAWPASLSVGDTIFYESADLEGNPLRSKAIFSEAKVTMINLWATWCKPCLSELPELGRMAKEFEEQGCQIIGVCMDANTPELRELALSQLRDAGADYLNLMAEDYVYDVFPLTAYPTTVFVDREGVVLLKPIVGVQTDAYREALAEALSLVE